MICCGKPIDNWPQYIKPGKKMYEYQYGRGVPIGKCTGKCGKIIYSEQKTAVYVHGS